VSIGHRNVFHGVDMEKKIISREKLAKIRKIFTDNASKFPTILHIPLASVVDFGALWSSKTYPVFIAFTSNFFFFGKKVVESLEKFLEHQNQQTKTNAVHSVLVGPTRNRTGVARTVQARSLEEEGSEPEVITATL
jgi:hypothetical protein